MYYVLYTLALDKSYNKLDITLQKPSGYMFVIQSLTIDSKDPW